MEADIIRLIFSLTGLAIVVLIYRNAPLYPLVGQTSRKGRYERPRIQ